MLSVLRVSNLAIVEEVEIEFGPGLNVITGETGAGKSLLLKAIDLLSGGKSNGNILRSGANQASVEGLFIPTKKQREELLRVGICADVIGEGDEIVIRRTFDSGGRGKCYINGQLCSKSELQQLSPYLISITGQGEQQTLLSANVHRQIVDGFGVSERLLGEVKEAFNELSLAQKYLQSFLHESDKQSEYCRRIKFECEELDKAAIRPGERDELEAELKHLANVENLSRSLDQALQLLEGDTEGIDLKLRHLLMTIAPLVALDPQIESIHALVKSAAAELSETRVNISQYLARLDADPERLEVLRDRIAEIAHIERKFGGKSVGEILEYHEKIKAELSQFDGGMFDEGKLRLRLSEAEAKYSTIAEKLSISRKKIAKELEKEVETELDQLNMKRSKFAVDISPTNPSSVGSDKVQFLLSANPGEPLKVLSDVASGGELSRVLLVLKSIFNEKLVPCLQVFDEVDTGVGGAVAQVVGEKLKRISKSGQTLVVTHAPQIAALGDTHMVISKSTTKDRTRVDVKVLSDSDRIGEIARMLAGKKVTSQFEASAKELLSTTKH